MARPPQVRAAEGVIRSQQARIAELEGQRDELARLLGQATAFKTREAAEGAFDAITRYRAALSERDHG